MPFPSLLQTSLHCSELCYPYYIIPYVYFNLGLSTLACNVLNTPVLQCEPSLASSTQ